LEKFKLFLEAIDAYIAHRKIAPSLPSEGEEVKEYIDHAAYLWRRVLEERGRI
jgi:hypothetical protein